MKKICVYLLACAVMILSGCSSSSKLLQKRYYDAAIAKACKKLMKKPDKQKEIDVLAKAYKIANEEDNDRIKYLKKSNEPQVWEEIYSIYNRMKYRQNLVKPLDAKIRQAINYKYVDYDQELIDSKRKAADFLYNEGNTFLARNNRFDAREAHARFTRVKEYMPSYPGIDNKINEAYAKGVAYAYFKIQNATRQILPRDFEEDLMKVSLSDINNMWLVFDSRYDKTKKYDYTIVLQIRKIEITPEVVATNEYVEAKDVEDGFHYALDKKGNVMKDSLGNDIKVKKYKTLKCYVTKFSLGKSATVGGTLDFFDDNTKQMIKTDPISATSKFELVYAIAKGEQAAMTPETRKLTSIKITPFPSNEEMIYRTAETLKQFTKDIVHANRQLLR